LILGEEEVRSATATVRDMVNSQQKRVPLNQLVPELLEVSEHS